MERNLRLYPLIQAGRFAILWQPLWFLYFQQSLSGAEALMLAAIYDMCVVLLEVPSGYFSDVLGRRVTMRLSLAAYCVAYLMFYFGGFFFVFAIGQFLMGLGSAMASGTDSALLYESLAALGRESEVAQMEARAWRYAYISLGSSAILGGIIGLYSFSASYLITFLISCATLVAVWRLTEPDGARLQEAEGPIAQFRTILGTFRNPVLAWIFVFAVVAIIFEELPYIFIQPYIDQMLLAFDLNSFAPLIVGLIIGVMMGLSAFASDFALWVRGKVGVVNALMVSMVMQVTLIGAMGLIVHPIVSLLLIMRMVPSALRHPIVIEAIQPRLENKYRATYLSFQNLSGRLILSTSIFIGAWTLGSSQAVDAEVIGQLLPFYAIFGCVTLLILWLSSFKLGSLGQHRLKPN